MTIRVDNLFTEPKYKTLGELIEAEYPGFTVNYGAAPLDMDITHGYEIEYNDNRKFGYGETATIYPYIKWSDGIYNPCHYWGDKYYLALEKRS